MTTLKVDAGACGCWAKIVASRVDDRHVQVRIESDCEQVVKMNEDLAKVQWKGQGHKVFGSIVESAVYRSAASHIRHTACPIPSAILKAIEVEVGAAVPSDVSFVFVRPASSEGDSDPARHRKDPPAPSEIDEPSAA